MIRRVRRQFICITMTMLTTVLMVPLVAINVITEAMSYNQTRDILEQIAISETAIPEDPHAPNGIPPEPDPKQTDSATGTTVATTVMTTSTGDSGKTAHTTTTARMTVFSKQTTAPSQVTQAQAAQTQAPMTKASQAKAPSVMTTRAVSRETKPVVTAAPPATVPPQTLPPDPWRPQDDWGKWEPEEPDNPWYEIHPDHAALSAAFLQLSAPQKILCANALHFQAAQMGQEPKPNDWDRPLRDRKDKVITIDHFLCYADTSGKIIKVEGTENYTEEDGQILIDYVMDAEKNDGWYGNLQYFRMDYAKGTLVVFSDRSAERLLLHKVLLMSILVFLLMEGVVFFLTMLFTRRAIRPIQETIEQQRQFISDAGHELKTPLTIISANVDILEDEIGDNKWLSYIRSQAERMRILIGNMMNLTKLEMENFKKDFASFSLSAAVAGAALPFESQAFEQEKKLLLEIQENLQYFGNSDQMKQLVGIFIDNAIKYSDEHGEIRVTLQQVQNKKVLKIFNTGKGIPEEEKEKIFERFYRSDASRARATGGYGLGLSIAKRIADTHKIKIQVESEYEHWICFILTF